MKRLWTESDDSILQRMASSGARVSEIAIALNRSVQVVRNKAIVLGISFRQARIEGATGIGRCRCACPGSNDCCLRGDVYHEIHICTLRDCVCHSRARYDEERWKEANEQTTA